MKRFQFVWILLSAAALVGGSRTIAKDLDDGPLRVLSYNIHHGEGVDGRLDLERIAKVIRSVRPDLVALQEVDVRAERSGGVDQAAELARLTGMNVVFGGNIDLQGGKYGNAVLSRFPILRYRNHLLPNVDGGEQRGVIDASVEIPGWQSPLRFLATHLDHRHDGRERLASAEAINALVASRPDRTALLAGDLNAVLGSKPLDKFESQWQHTNIEPLPTIPVGSPERQIDFILYRPARYWRVVDVRVLDEAVASDHRAILAVLQRSEIAAE